DERENRQRVGEGPEESRDEVADEAGRLWWRSVGIHGLGADLGDAEVDQEQAADDADPVALLLEEGAEPSQAESSDQTIARIGRGGAEAADEPGEAAVGERTADAQDADRADRRRDGEADQRTLPQQIELMHPAEPYPESRGFEPDFPTRK